MDPENKSSSTEQIRDFAEEIAAFPTEQELYTALECPVCNEVPLPPIYNCTTGHILCNVCRKSLKKCGICNGEFTKSRNFFMENVVAICKFWCQYKNNGCPERINGDLLKHHIANCFYRNGPLNDKAKHSLNANTPRCFYWIDARSSETVPPNSVSGGLEDGSYVYVVRKLLPSKALVPGKFITNSNSNMPAFFWDNKLYVTKTFEILTATPDTLDWLPFSTDENTIGHAVIGGKSDIGEVLHIGRKSYQGKICIGFIQGNPKKLTYVIDRINHESTPPFEILVKNRKGILLENSLNY